jgi:hypothetical protein
MGMLSTSVLPTRMPLMALGALSALALELNVTTSAAFHDGNTWERRSPVIRRSPLPSLLTTYMPSLFSRFD